MIDFTELPPGAPYYQKKALVLKHYAVENKISVLVETGTAYGETILFLKDCFKTIYSIELSQHLFESTREKLAEFKHIHLLQGDSSEVLPSVLKLLKRPAVFWLDAHYCSGNSARGPKETPVLEELDVIFQSKRRPHVILIDDIGCFGSHTGYPNQLELKRFICSKRPSAMFELCPADILAVTNLEAK